MLVGVVCSSHGAAVTVTSSARLWANQEPVVVGEVRLSTLGSGICEGKLYHLFFVGFR